MRLQPLHRERGSREPSMSKHPLRHSIRPQRPTFLRRGLPPRPPPPSSSYQPVNNLDDSVPLATSSGGRRDKTLKPTSSRPACRASSGPSSSMAGLGLRTWPYYSADVPCCQPGAAASQRSDGGCLPRAARRGTARPASRTTVLVGRHSCVHTSPDDRLPA